jgi:putative hydrolase of the HAD superfamily
MSNNLNHCASWPTRAVFFDLAGTLIRVRGGIGAQYAAIARQFGVEADAGAIDRAFKGAFERVGRMVFPRPDAAEVASLEKEFWKQVVRLILAETGALQRFGNAQFDRYFDHLFDYFATSAGWTVYPDVVPALDRLKRGRLIVGLITNFDRRVFRLIEALGLSRFIDSVTIPSLAGAAKPEAAIFEYALARHGLRAGEAVQVGDSIRDDVEGARAAGLRGVLIDRKTPLDVARGGPFDIAQGAQRGMAAGPQPGTDEIAITSLEALPRLLGLHDE